MNTPSVQSRVAFGCSPADRHMPPVNRVNSKSLPMPTTRKNSKRYEESKASVVAAAISVINQKGVSRMTLADVAEKLGFAAPAISYYFKKKDDLAVACLLKGLSRMEEFIAVSEKSPDSKTRLNASLIPFLTSSGADSREKWKSSPTSAIHVPWMTRF